MTVRRAREDDAAALIDLWKRFMAEEHEAVTDTEPQAALTGWSERLRVQIEREQVFVLETDRGLAGFVAFIDATERSWVPERVAYIVDLYVQPEDRRAGAARALMAALMDAIAKAGYREVWTNTALTNQRMQILLKRADFGANPDFSIPGLRDQVYLKREL